MINNPFVKQIKLKREFLDEQSQHTDVKFPRSSFLSGSMWYSQEAARAVNQAIGRVIRHRHDYGAIIFCDDRFEQPSQQSQISLWIRPYVKCYPRYGEVISDLARFFRTERSSFPARLVTEQENNIVSTMLPKETANGVPTPASDNSNVKNVGGARNELSRLEAFPPANRASSSDRELKWKGLRIVQRTGKMPVLVKRDVMQACSSVKAKLVDLGDDETPVERRCEVVDLESDKCEKQSSCFNTMGLVKKRKVPESEGSASSTVSKEKGSGGGDNKEANASAFLSQVKAKLNTEEYKKFIGYVQALKKKELKLADVMQSIVQLLCGTERDDQLLMGFRDFVPVKYRPAYEQCIRTRERREA